MAIQETLIESFRLSPQQRHLCAMQRIEEPFPFRTYYAVQLEGQLDTWRLRSALKRLVERYEILRTSFPCLPGLRLPVQVIKADIELPLFVQDYSYASPDEQEAILRQLREVRLDQAASLQDERLWQMTLIVFDDEHRWLFWDMSALCADTKTCQVLLQELIQLYGQDSHDELSEPLQYADLAEWQYELLESPETEEGRAYWRTLEHDVLKDVSLPFEVSTKRLLPFARRSLASELSSVAYAQLLALAQKLSVSPASVLLACWGTVLARLSGERSLPISSAYSGRAYAELSEAVGLLAKFLPLSYQFMEDVRFSDVVRQVDALQHEADTWQTYFDWSLFETLKGQEQEPFSNFGFDYDTLPAVWQTGSLRWKVEEQEVCLERFSVSLSCLETEQNVRITLHYDAEKFAPEDMQRLLTQWQIVVQQVLSSPDVALGMLQLLTNEEQQEILLDWNATQADYPQTQRLHDLFEMQVERTPDSIAVVYADEQISYRELDKRANQVACYLQRNEVGPEVRVGICLERSPYLLIGMLGVLKAEGTYVPCDPSYPQERLAFVLHDAAIPLLLTEKRLLEQLPVTASKVVCLDAVKDVFIDDAGVLLKHTGSVEQLAYVLYTSGSTGQPKGVMVPHSGLVNYLYWAQKEYAASSLSGTYGAPLHSPIGFDLTVTSLFVPLLSGQSVLLLSEDEGIAELGNVLSSQNKFALTKLTPAHLDALGQFVVAEKLADGAQTLVIGGEALWLKSLALWQQYAPQTRLINEYGPTETVVGCCVYEVSGETPTSGSVPIGKPIANMQMYVLNAYLQPVPVGVAAELYVGGVGVTRGYLNRPELTAASFIPHPFSRESGARLYRTGDLARYLPSGDLEYIGRADQQVKIRGFRIEPGEVELQLRKHPEIQECIVQAREDVPGDKRLVAYVVLRQKQTLRSTNIRTYLQDYLPSYMIPSVFVPLTALPLTPNGKVDRRKLPAIGDLKKERAEDFVAPRTSIEATLVAIWSQVLHLEQIGVHDNFFALGGDSILSIQVVTRAKQAGLYMIPRQLFQYQSIAQLSAVVTSVAAPQAEQALVTGRVSLIPIQHWFFARNLPVPPHFNQAVLLETNQKLSPGKLQQALVHLILHHDALRLRFAHQIDGWQAEIAGPPSSAILCCIDISALPESSQQLIMATLIEEAQTSIDLAGGLLLRALFFMRDSASDDRLLLAVHHLAMDGVSWRILLEDLDLVCRQLSQNEPPLLNAKTTSWKQWTQQIQDYAQTQALQAVQGYWLAEQRRDVSLLPVDMSEGANTIATSETLRVSLSARQTQALLQEVPAAYHTQINDVLLAALAQALALWTGQKRVLVDLEGHGREEIAGAEVDLARTVGWFTTLFPLLLDIEQADGPGDALKAVKEQLRQVPQRGLSYGVLRYMHSDFSISEQLARMPQAQVLFNYFGQFEDMSYERTLFRPASVSAGEVHSQQEPRSHLLEINGRVVDGELHVVWRYSREVHQRETIEKLAQSFIDALEKLIAHCQMLERSVHTPSDFPLAVLTQQQLDDLTQRIGQEGVHQSAQPLEIEDIYPLSPMQAGLLFHCLYDPNSSVYCGYFGWTLQGPFDADAWQWAWQQVINRHPILRTLFVWQGLTEPLQVVCKRVELPWAVQDWRSLSVQEREQHLDVLHQKEEHEGFNLQHAPLLRLSVVRLEDQTFYFHLAVHHLLLDGWSQALLIGEVQVAYLSYKNGERAQSAAVRPYRDYIAWLQQQNTVQTEQFWRRYLLGFTAPVRLAIDAQPYKSRGRSQRIVAVEQRTFPAVLTETLQDFGKQHQLTLNTIVQGAWALLLARYSGSTDVIFGATVAGRPAELTGIEAMIGLFINTLPVRVYVEQEADLLSWLTQIQESQAEVRQYEYTPLVDIQHWSEIPLEQALFDSLLLFQNYPLDPMQEEDESGLTIQGKRSVEYTNYALTLKAAVAGDMFTVQLAYDAGRFDAVTMARFMDHFQMVLDAIVAHSQQRLADVPLLTDTERHMLLREWNATQASFPTDMRIDELFERQVALTPDAVVLVFQDTCVTYRFVDQAATRIATHLQGLNIPVGSHIGLCIERSLAQVIGMLGILKAGGAYVPLDPTYPHERLTFMLEDSQAAALITQPWLLEIFPEQTAPCLLLTDALLNSGAVATTTRKGDSEQVAYMIYTSGSTGRPKGTMISHRAVGNFFASMRKRPGMTADDRILAVTSCSFDIAALELLLPLTLGACVHIASQQVLADGIELAALLNLSGASLLQATPSTWGMLLAAGWTGHAGLKMLCGGEALAVELAQQLQPCGAELWNMYGPTETTIWSAVEKVGVTEGQGISIGRAIDNTQIYVLDEMGALVPVGVVGELYIAGEGVAYGYWQRPDLSSERFLPDPFSQQPGARMYRSGDRARWLENGTLECLGRIDQQIKLRGHRIELNEIATVLRDHPAVQEAVVILCEESETNKYLAAYIVAQAGMSSMYQDLQVHLHGRLPDYMVPGAFVYLDALPLTPNGKINRKALPSPVSGQGHLDDEFIAPETATQEQLAEIWVELLQLPRVSIQQNFFALGGNSLLATRLMMRIRSIFLIEVPLRSLFEAQTIAALALVIGRIQNELIEQLDSEELAQILQAQE